MGRDFSTKEARQLIRTHEVLLQSLTAMASLPETLQADIRSCVQTMVSHGVPDGILERDVVRGRPAGLRSAGSDRLVSDLYLFRHAQAVIDEAQQLIELDGEGVRDDIRLLQAGKNGLRWLLAGAADKTRAAEAFGRLQRLASGTYGRTAGSLSVRCDALQRTPAAEMWADAEADPEGYAAALGSLLPEAAAIGGPAPCFGPVLGRYTGLDERRAAAEAAEESAGEDVRDAAGQLTAAGAVRILQDVPVEELNREYSGFRVKTFRDNGVLTMADICMSPVSVLCAINGISREAAAMAKQIAGRYAERAREGVRIRLSSDDRTAEAEALVRAVYRFKTLRNRLEAYQTFVGTEGAATARDVSTLSALGNGVGWFFGTAKQRDAVRSAWRRLSEDADGAYLKQADALLTAAEEPVQADSGTVWEDLASDTIAYYTILEEVVPGMLGNDDSRYGLPEELAREIRDEEFFADGLTCTLRNYQVWGVKYILHQKRVLLGDEMGLGKTVQAIAAMTALRHAGATHFLVVCPASVLSNWCREIIKHSALQPVRIHGAGRAAALRSWLRTGGVAVTTYETTGYIPLGEEERFDMLIVDEAHYIKNPEAKRTIHVKRIAGHTDRLLFMTGTALENRVDEMLALIGILQPQIASEARSRAFMAAAPQFRELIAPVYYRRRREDVLQELPELIESREWCPLTREEETVYEQTLLAGNYAAVRRLSWNVGDLHRSSKAGRLLELVAEAASEGRKILVFSFFLDTIRDLGALLGSVCHGPINGAVPPQRRQEIIDGFDAAPAGSVLLAQIQSGGTGLNIQSASVVILCEPQFKPSTENQAVSRAYRMGQDRNVLVYRLLSEDTVDEHIMEILDRKQEIFDAFADTSAAAEQSAGLDEKTFAQIVKEEAERRGLTAEATGGQDRRMGAEDEAERRGPAAEEAGEGRE